MAQMSIDDFLSYGYNFPGTGGSLVITIESNIGTVHSFEISGNGRSNIVSFSATEDGNEVEVIEFEPGADYAVELNAAGEYVEITIEVSESPSLIDDNYSFDTYFDYEQQSQSVVISQDGYTPPAPVWEDGQHKIYRSGQQVMKMYRNGELIYLRLNPPSEEPPAPPTPTENWVDLTTIDNNTPIYNIAWLTDQGFSTINDTWFSEAPGLVTDSYVDNGTGWSSGKTQDKGYYTYHRMSDTHKKYSCTFLDQYYTGNGATVAYGVAMSDASINQLPTGTINGNTYYMLNIVDWQNWKPLYIPLSTPKIQSTYVEGKILVDIAPKT